MLADLHPADKASGKKMNPVKKESKHKNPKKGYKEKDGIPQNRKRILREYFY